MDRTPRLFVSHSHEDDPFCLRLIADLRANLGDDAVWFDTSGGLHGSDDWWDRIIAEISERPYFLVVLSPNASASKWVPEEMAIAYRQKVELGKTLLPVRLAESPRREDWRGIQEFDFTHNDDPASYATALTELLHVILPTITVPVIGAPYVTPAAPAPERPLSLTERLAQEAHGAYAREHWSDVLDKTEILVERGAMTPALWRERASAAFALGDNSIGLAVIKQALQAGTDDSGTLLLYVRLVAKAGDDNQAVEILTRAYSLTSLDDTATRLTILDGLTAALARLDLDTHRSTFIGAGDPFTDYSDFYRYRERIRDDYARRVNDARRIAPDDLYWALREVEMLLRTQRYDEALAAVSTLPVGKDAKSVLPAWQAAISSAAKGPWDGTNRLTYHALFDAAINAGVDSSVLAHWRFEFPHFVPRVSLSGYSGNGGTPEWSPDSKRLAFYFEDGVRVWDAVSGRLFGILPARGVMAWAPDGTRIAFATTGATTEIWDTTNGRLLVTLAPPASTGARRLLFGGSTKSTAVHGSLLGVVWSPSGTQLVTTGTTSENARSMLMQVWHAMSGRLQSTLFLPHHTHVMAWSPDGALLALLIPVDLLHDLYNVTVCETVTGRRLATLSGASAGASAAWSPDGTQLAAASSDGVVVWNAATWRPTVSLANAIGGGPVWSPDGTRLVVGNRGIWEAASGKQLATLAGSEYGGGYGLHHLSWSADGRRIVGYKGYSSTSMSEFELPARLDPATWDAASGQEISGSLPSHEIGRFVTWSPDGARLAVSDTNNASIWGEE